MAGQPCAILETLIGLDDVIRHANKQEKHRAVMSALLFSLGTAESFVRTSFGSEHGTYVMDI